MTNVASIKAKLKSQSMASGKTMQGLLVAYGLERTIYRLSISRYVDFFILKGGLFLYALYDGIIAPYRFGRRTFASEEVDVS